MQILDRVRIKNGWFKEGMQGTLLAVVHVGQDWGVVIWDEDEDPDCFKLAGLEELDGTKRK